MGFWLLTSACFYDTIIDGESTLMLGYKNLKYYGHNNSRTFWRSIGKYYC